MLLLLLEANPTLGLWFFLQAGRPKLKEGQGGHIRPPRRTNKIKVNFVFIDSLLTYNSVIVSNSTSRPRSNVPGSLILGGPLH